MTAASTSTAVLDDPLGSEPPARSAVRTTTPRILWRNIKVPVLLAVLILATAFGVTFFRQRARVGELDPSAVDSAGSRAVAELLRDRGVPVRRVVGLPDSAVGTVFVPFTDTLSAVQMRSLTTPAAGTHVVLVAPAGRLSILGVDVTSADNADSGVRVPGCSLPAAVSAGRADAGGTSYDVGAGEGATVHTCYASSGHPTLVRVERADADVTVLGSATAFTNGRLDEEGNAALALSLLDNGGPVTWVVRRPAGTAPPGEARGLVSLLPDGVILGAVQLVIAALVAMVWRARRLGPVVTEPLPVVVRAAEAVEGRGRLYAAANARGRAAANLRGGALRRLRGRLRLPADATPDALVIGAAERTNAAPAVIARLLYGPDPADDAALVRLASDLDDVDSEVRRS